MVMLPSSARNFRVELTMGKMPMGTNVGMKPGSILLFAHWYQKVFSL